MKTEPSGGEPPGKNFDVDDDPDTEDASNDFRPPLRRGG